MGSKVPHMREPIEDLHVPPPRVHFAKPPRNYITNPASGGKPKPYESAPQYMELLGVPDALPDEPDPSLRYMPDTSLNPLQKDEVEKARMERSPYLAMLKHKEQDSLLPLARPFSIQQGPIGTLGVSIRDQVRSRRSVALSPSAFGPDGEPLSAREGEEDEVLATLMLDEDGEEDGEAERPASALERARLAPLTPLEMKKLAKMFLIAELRRTHAHFLLVRRLWLVLALVLYRCLHAVLSRLREFSSLLTFYVYSYSGAGAADCTAVQNGVRFAGRCPSSRSVPSLLAGTLVSIACCVLFRVFALTRYSCLQVWSVPLHLIAFLFRAFDSYVSLFFLPLCYCICVPALSVAYIEYTSTC